MGPRKRLIAGLLMAPLLLLAACSSSSSSSDSGGGGGAGCTYTFAVITHGDNGNFWSVVYKGAKDAAKDYGCKLSETYGSQQQGQAEPDDNAENAQIQDAVNQKVDGIAVSDHDPSVMNSTLASAAAAGIPVVLLNAGCDDAGHRRVEGDHLCRPAGEPGRPEGGPAVRLREGQQRAVRDPPVRVRTCSTAATVSPRALASRAASARPATRRRPVRRAPS